MCLSVLLTHWHRLSSENNIELVFLMVILKNARTGGSRKLLQKQSGTTLVFLDSLMEWWTLMWQPSILVCTMGSVIPWWRLTTMQLHAKPRNTKLVADLFNRTPTRMEREHWRKEFSLHLITISSPPLQNVISKDFNPSVVNGGRIYPK